MVNRYLVLVFIALLASSPAFGGEGKKDATSSVPVRVRVGIPTIATDFLPIYTAKAKEFYRDEGLDVEIIIIGTSQGVAATLTGELQFNGTLNATIRTAIQGRPVRAILALNRNPGYWLFVRHDIHSMNDLAGQTVATGNPGSSTHTFTVFILKKFGLAGKVRVLPAGTGSREAALALLSGNVAAAYANSDTYVQLEEKGFRKLLNYADYINHPTSGIGTSQKMIESRPQIVQAFVNATYKGMTYFKKNRLESVGLMVKFQKRDEKTASRVYDLDVASFGGDGTIGCEVAENEIQLQKEFIGSGTAAPCEQVIDKRFAQNIPLSLKLGDNR